MSDPDTSHDTSSATGQPVVHRVEGNFLEDFHVGDVNRSVMVWRRAEADRDALPHHRRPLSPI